MKTTLELFNAVPAKDYGRDYIVLTDYGVIIEPLAAHARVEIESFLTSRRATGTELNASFHKSWKKILSSSPIELRMHQLMHYLSTYGTGFDSEFTYIPDETLDVPQRVNFIVIRGWTSEKIIDECLKMLQSGVALKEATVDAILQTLKTLGYSFKTTEGIKNKEALIKICDSSGIVPSDKVEFVRYLVYLATGSTTLIKNKESYRKILLSPNGKRISAALQAADIKVLAECFNRFKPIFLSFKTLLKGDKAAKARINLISKLSKDLHKPISKNILNEIGSVSIDELYASRKSLLNANFFQLARCIQFLRQNSVSTSKVYQVRNGKVFTKIGSTLNAATAAAKIAFLLDLIKEKYPLDGLAVHIPEDVFYALPTSEKAFVGNVPFGSKFVSDDISIGVFWRNSGGANDIDVSALSVNGKTGWNASYNGEETLYSGDMTYAHPCAVEYIRTKEKFNSDHMILANIFNGESEGSIFNIVVGAGSDVTRDSMMDPNNVWISEQTKSIKKETIVGLLTKDGSRKAAIVVNLAFGRSAVSSGDAKSTILRDGLTQRWKNCFYLNELLEYCGANLVSKDDAEIDLSPDKLTRNSLTSLFS